MGAKLDFYKTALRSRQRKAFLDIPWPRLLSTVQMIGEQ